MAIYTSILTGGVSVHTTTSEEANYVATDFVSAGIVGSLTNTNNVAPMTGAFAVNAQGTPDMTVAVTAGSLYMAATPSGQGSQKFRVRLSANENVTISANSSGSTKYDWIYSKIDPTAAANPNLAGDDVASLVVSRSSSNTTDNGTPPTYGYNIAVVTVANGASSITNANIADKRVQAGVNSLAAATVQMTDMNEQTSEYLSDFIASGGVVAQSAGLVGTFSDIVYYISGVRYTATSVANKTYTASKDTYVDINSSGTPTYTEVANGAASPALTAGYIRVAKVVTNGSAITSVTQVGSDSLGNLIYNTDSHKQTVWRAWTPTFTNLTTGDGTVVAYYTQVGKTVTGIIKFTMGSTSAVSGTIQFTLPVLANSRYGTIQTKIGSVYFEDSGVLGYDGGIRCAASATVATVYAFGATSTYSTVVSTSSTIPFTWANTDFFAGTFTYEAA